MKVVTEIQEEMRMWQDLGGAEVIVLFTLSKPDSTTRAVASLPLK
jgi:hypothetical protein